MTRSILHTSDLTIGYKLKKYYTYIVCSAINLELFRGELVCLLGPNGSGKSTLLRTLAGIQAPLSGEVLINNESMTRKSNKDLAYLISIVLTENIAVGMLNVFGLVAMGRIPHTNWLGKLTPADRQKIYEALELVSMREFVNRPAIQLSDGERQRIMIARALAQDTPVIILDEPTVHLDLPGRVDTMRLLRKLTRETRKAILLSTHELDLALQVADTIWLMEKNRPLQTGGPEDLVLNGNIKKVFVNEAFDFDMKTGHFLMSQTSRGKISLRGEGIVAFWTKRALTREGYQVVREPNRSLAVVVDDQDNSWRLTAAGKQWKFATIKDLILWLRALESDN